MGEPARDTHHVRYASPNRDSEDVALPGVFAPLKSDDGYISIPSNDNVTIGAKDQDATTSMSQVLLPTDMRVSDRSEEITINDAPTFPNSQAPKVPDSQNHKI